MKYRVPNKLGKFGAKYSCVTQILFYLIELQAPSTCGWCGWSPIIKHPCRYHPTDRLSSHHV